MMTLIVCTGHATDYSCSQLRALVMFLMYSCRRCWRWIRRSGSHPKQRCRTHTSRKIRDLPWS